MQTARRGLSVLAAGRSVAARATVRSFRSTAATRITYDEWAQAKPHCHHQSLWKEFKPVGPNGGLLSGNHPWAGNLVGLEPNPEVIEDLTEMLEYTIKVLNSMNDSEYKRQVMQRTEFKLKVLKSGKTKEEMEEEIGFGVLEEVHAATRGELELIKALGKDWFDSPPATA
mmetsp:Transcript_14220/g.34785  ORF Transcript_14220/g.34785 Transcript_14220/m.34785 type:complete len:170 (-) Transcript_14220:220-729(-)